MIHVLLHWSIFGKTQVGDSVQRWPSVSAASNEACAAVASYLQYVVPHLFCTFLWSSEAARFADTFLRK